MQEWEKHEPLPGFQKTTTSARKRLTPEQRSTLIRRGNELFNQGKYREAKRVFITVRYSDGLIRLAKLHHDRGEPLEAFRMYWLAGAENEAQAMIERMAHVVRHWLSQGSPDTQTTAEEEPARAGEPQGRDPAASHSGTGPSERSDRRNPAPGTGRTTARPANTTPDRGSLKSDERRRTQSRGASSTSQVRRAVTPGSFSSCGVRGESSTRERTR